MTVSEKVAYIKGLAENAGFTDDAKDKVVKAIIDVLEDIADSIGEINEQLDAVDEDLAALEEDFYEDDEDYDDDDFDDDDDDDFCYEVECPACHDVIYLDDEMIDEGGIKCPNCGQELEYDISCDECGDCSGCDEEE